MPRAVEKIQVPTAAAEIPVTAGGGNILVNVDVNGSCNFAKDIQNPLKKFGGKIASYIKDGPGGGNPNLTIAFKTHEDAEKYLHDFYALGKEETLENAGYGSIEDHLVDPAYVSDKPLHPATLTDDGLDREIKHFTLDDVLDRSDFRHQNAEHYNGVPESETDLDNRGSKASHKAIKDYVQPAGRDPLERVKETDLEEVPGKMEKSLMTFMRGATAAAKVADLFHKGSGDKASDTHARNLDELVHRYAETTTAPITIYRPTGPVPEGESAVGHELHDQTFLSGTTDLTKALEHLGENHLTAIELPAGTKVVRHGDDFLLPRGQRVEITDHARVGDQGPHILQGRLK